MIIIHYFYIGATIGFDQSIYIVREDEAEVEVCVEMIDLPDGGLECDVIAYLDTDNFEKTGISDITKTSQGSPFIFAILYSTEIGADFSEPAIFNVVFPAFETEGNDTRCLLIPIINDGQLEGDFQLFYVSIANINPSNVLSNGLAATVRILDDNGDGKNTRYCSSTKYC